MALSPEERERIAREHLAALEAREAEKARAAKAQQELERQQQEEKIRREEEIRQIKAQVEEAFYGRRGYVKYVNHRGKVLWLTPEEYRLRKERKRRTRRKNRIESTLTRYRQVVFYLLVAAVALLVGAYLAR